jgi:uncharacterized protein (DUF1800 family)
MAASDDPSTAPDPTQTARALVARAGIRASASDLARIAKDGWAGWVRWQLSLGPDDDAATQAALADAKLRIEYDQGEGHAALKEDRPYTTLKAPIASLWHLADWDTKMHWEERVRPANELACATLLRAALAQGQLREVIADVWRDHFSVNRDAHEHVAIALPTYDRDVIRAHGLGNFRQFLEAVATSTAMLSYLNNASSRASPANENYARELFELHTLGAGAYLNDRYDRWREVPGAADGRPEGYIDQDVYEAARALTGWTFANGQEIAEGQRLPKTGEWSFAESWHDPYQKRVLATEFDAHPAPMSDGRKVLDLAAFHPATLRNIASTLCRRFVADDPSPSFVTRIAAVFEAFKHSPDQIARTVEAILVSEEFAAAQPRIQRPLFYLASIQRQSGVILAPTPDHVWLLGGMGQRLYSWHTPAGHPNRSAYWQSPGLMVRRWRALMDIWQQVFERAPAREWPSTTAFAEHWTAQLGLPPSHAKRPAELLRREFGGDPAITLTKDTRWTAAQAVALLCATPDYQMV